MTPFHYALKREHTSCVEFFIIKGTDLTLTDQKGRNWEKILLQTMKQNYNLEEDQVWISINILVQTIKKALIEKNIYHFMLNPNKIDFKITHSMDDASKAVLDQPKKDKEKALSMNSYYVSHS